MKIIILVLSVLMAIPALGQRKNRTDEIAGPTFVEGIIYALPRTGFRINVTAVKETFEPGPYATFACQLLGITDAKPQSSVQWFFDNVELETFSEPDPNQVRKAMGNASFLISLTPAGCLAGINANSFPEGSIVFSTNSFVEKIEKEDDFSFSNINDRPVFAPGDSTNNFRPVRISNERKAAEAAERILNSRLTRYHIAAGLMDEFHPDGEAYDVSIRELEKIEKNYLSLFTGRTTYHTEQYSFDFVPTTSSDRGQVVFRFSEETGVLPADDLSGKPVMIKVEPENILLSKYSELASSANPAAGESGIYYRMPAMANISLLYELGNIATARTVVAQFGQVAPVPEELLYGEYSLEFHTETGAVKSVTKK